MSELVSDCCGAEYEMYLSFRMADEGWYCTECGEPCIPVDKKGEIK